MELLVADKKNKRLAIIKMYIIRSIVAQVVAGERNEIYRKKLSSCCYIEF